jgi:hypothetical protein
VSLKSPAKSLSLPITKLRRRRFAGQMKFA